MAKRKRKMVDFDRWDSPRGILMWKCIDMQSRAASCFVISKLSREADVAAYWQQEAAKSHEQARRSLEWFLAN